MDPKFTTISVINSMNVGGSVIVSSKTESVDISSGALIVSGGAGITKSIFIGEDITVTDDLTVGGDTSLTGTLNVFDVTNIQDATSSTSVDSGALVVSGGVGIAENLNVGKNISISGVNTENTNITITNEENVTSSSFATVRYTLNSKESITVLENGKYPGQIINLRLVSIITGTHLIIKGSSFNLKLNLNDQYSFIWNGSEWNGIGGTGLIEQD